MKRLLIVSSFLVAAAPAAVSAHAKLLDPPPRSAADGNKVGPCDTTPDPNAATTTYMAGSTINVEWMETIEHPGRYRIAFAPTNDTGFDDNILMEVVDDKTAPANWSVPVTLPSTPCEGCTLQLIQCMTAAGADPATAPCSNYYSCANIRLVTVADDAGPDAPDAGADAPDAGAAGPDASGGGGDDDGTGDPPGLGVCSAAPGGHGSAWLALGLGAFALGLGLARRRAVRAPARTRR